MVDYWNGRVQRKTATGSPLGVVTRRTAQGVHGGICIPYNVYPDAAVPATASAGEGTAGSSTTSDGSFWVADQNCHRVVKFTHSGATALVTIGMGGTPNYPVGCGGGKMWTPTYPLPLPGGARILISDSRCAAIYEFTTGGTFVGEWGDWAAYRAASGATKIVPRGIDRGADGNIYVAENEQNAVIKFSPDGTYLGHWSQPGMDDPRQLTIDRVNGFIYVVGVWNSQIFKFTMGGALLALLGYWGTERFGSPRGVGVDTNGNVLVPSTWDYKSYRFTKDLAPISWATPAEPPPNGGYNYVDAVAAGAGGLYVTDQYENSFQRFNLSSFCVWKTNCRAFLGRFGKRTTHGEGFGYPSAAAWGDDGYVYIGDHTTVSKWTPDGTYLSEFGTLGRQPGQFQGNLRGIDTENSFIYTVDGANCRIQKHLEGVSPEGDPVYNFIEKIGTCGTGLGQLKGPGGIAVDGDLIYVSETGNNRVQLFNDATNTAVKIIAPLCDGLPLQAPQGLALDPTKSWIYLAETPRKRVVRISVADTSVCQIVTTGVETPQKFFAGPRKVAFTPAGELIVSDASRRVQKFGVAG